MYQDWRYMQGGSRLLGQNEAYTLTLCPDPHLLGVLFIEKVSGELTRYLLAALAIVPLVQN